MAKHIAYQYRPLDNVVKLSRVLTDAFRNHSRLVNSGVTGPAQQIFLPILRPPVGKRSIVMSVSVCPSICLFAGISQEPRMRTSSNFLCVCPVGCGCGSVILGRRCNTLCISGFVGDAVFPHYGPYGAGDTVRYKINVTRHVAAQIW